MNAQDTRERLETMVDEATSAIQSIVDAVRPNRKSMGSWELAGAITGAMLGGAVIGGAAVALLSPTSGPELRKKLSGIFEETQEKVSESVRKTGEAVRAEVASLRSDSDDSEQDDESKPAREKNGRRHAHA